MSRKNKKQKFILVSLITVSVIVICFSIFIFWFINKYTKTVDIYVNDAISLSGIESKPFLSSLCKINCDLNSIDTSKCGKTDIPIVFFGLIKKNITLNVIDNVPPEVKTKDVYISKGKAYTEDMFISSYFDHSDVQFTLSNLPDNTNTVGEYNLSLTAKDTSGNITETKVNLFITNASEQLTFEYGVTQEEVKDAVEKLLSEYPSISIPELDKCGFYEVTVQNDKSIFITDIIIKDTTPPEAWVKSFDIPLGQTVSETDIVTEIKDQTNVKTEIKNLPDFKKSGEYLLEITLTDEFENKSVYISTIRIHDINTDILVDEFSTDEYIISLIFKDEFSKTCLKFDTDNISDSLRTGINKFELVGEFNKIKIFVSVDDGTPPYFHVNDIKKALNTSLSPDDFVSYYYDATKITFSFEEYIDTSEEGVYSVGIIGTDKAGYSSVEYALLTVFEDSVPPSIYGVQDIYLAYGQPSPNYLSGISSLDNVTENIKVTVDASTVDLTKEGVYTIVYKAVDEAGNVTEAKANVNVTKKIKVRLNVMNILQKPNLRNGCEVVSLCIALNYLGYQIDPLTLYYDFMPQQDLYNGNPYYYYIGDPTDVGFGCYAPCVVTTGNDYIKSEKGTHQVYDVSGKDLSEYEKYLDEGVPVIMWGLLNMNGNGKRVWDDIFEGEEVVWHSNSHCLVLIGYTETGYIFCDPLVGITEYPKENVEKSFDINFRQACIIK